MECHICHINLEVHHSNAPRALTMAVQAPQQRGSEGLPFPPWPVSFDVPEIAEDVACNTYTSSIFNLRYAIWLAERRVHAVSKLPRLQLTVAFGMVQRVQGFLTMPRTHFDRDVYQS